MPPVKTPVLAPVSVNVTSSRSPVRAVCTRTDVVSGADGLLLAKPLTTRRYACDDSRYSTTGWPCASTNSTELPVIRTRARVASGESVFDEKPST